MTTICDDLRKAVLQAAIQGKLTLQLPEDGNAEDLYKEIQAEKQRLIKEGKKKKEKPLPEIAEDEIPFVIPDNWKWVRLGDITIKPVKRGKSPHYAATGNALVFAQKCNTKAGHINLGLAQYLDESYLDAYPQDEFLCDCDVVINSTGGGTLGRVGIYRESDNPRTVPVVPDSHVTVIRSMNSTMQLYLYRVLKFMQSELEEMGTGSTNQTELRPDTVKELLLPLPPLAEQERIAARVDELMAKIDEMEETEKDITALYHAFPRDMKAALLQAAIQGKLTDQLPEDGNAEDLYRSIQDAKQKLIKEGKIKKEKPLPEIAKKEIPFDIPENWKWVRLGDIGNLVRGSGIKKDETTKVGKPCVRYGEIYTSYWLEFSKVKTFTSDEVFSKCKLIRPGDLIFTLTGENKPDIAKTIAYLGNDNVAVGGDLAIWSNHYCNPKFLSYYMYSGLAIAQKVDAATGDMIVHISCNKIGRFLLPLPPLAEQKRIVEKLDQLLPLCDAMRADISGGVGA